jgi:L-lactate dehydrogenase (cytochrome)/(S)-mandelate dehydrogenase
VKPYNIATYREAARRRLPQSIFDYVDGGAEDEVTMRANSSAFGQFRLRYRVHETRDDVDLSTTVCGQPMTMPVMVSPVGNVGMIHHAGDAGMAQVAAKLGLIMMMSGGASYSIEEVARAAEPKPWYQLYPWIGREFYGELIDRAAAAGFRGLVLTVDTPVGANRERDIVNAFTIPPRLTRQNAAGILMHPAWTMNVLRHRRVVLRVFREDDTTPPLRTFVREANRTAGEVIRRNIRPIWDDIAWIRDRWRGPFGVKGIVDPGDARRAADLGADVIIVSNHGGRQLDSAPATFEALPAIVDAVGDSAEVILDGGVRRGTDVVKALCMGARAVSVGRPWVYGLGANGPSGAAAVLENFRRELTIAMNLLGADKVDKLDRSWLMPVGVPDGTREPRSAAIG